MQIAETLMKPIVPKRPTQRGRPTIRIRRQENSPSKNPRAASIPPPPISTRLDGFNYWPMSTIKGRCRHPGCYNAFKILKDKAFLIS